MTFVNEGWLPGPRPEFKTLGQGFGFKMLAREASLNSLCHSNSASGMVLSSPFLAKYLPESIQTLSGSMDSTRGDRFKTRCSFAFLAETPGQCTLFLGNLTNRTSLRSTLCMAIELKELSWLCSPGRKFKTLAQRFEFKTLAWEGN